MFDWHVMKTPPHTCRTHALVHSKSTQSVFSTEAGLIQRLVAEWSMGHLKCEEMDQRTSNSPNEKPGLFAVSKNPGTEMQLMKDLEGDLLH